MDTDQHGWSNPSHATVVAAADRKNHVSMEKFLRSGELGPIKLGTSREFIRKVFGEPDAVEVASSEHGLLASGNTTALSFSIRVNPCPSVVKNSFARSRLCV